MKVEIEYIQPDPTVQFTPMEMQSMRELFQSPAYFKLQQLVETMRPSANLTNGGSGSRDAFSHERVNARLGEIRGWEMHRGAIHAVLFPPQPKALAQEEMFQPAGIAAPMGEGTVEFE